MHTAEPMAGRHSDVVALALVFFVHAFTDKYAAVHGALVAGAELSQ